MRILITGMTTQQNYSTLTRLKLCTSIEAIAEALRILGHQVDWRRICLDEDLNQYDRIILGVSDLRSLSSRYAIHVLLALERYRDRCLLIVDDWQTRNIRSGFVRAMKVFPPPATQSIYEKLTEAQKHRVHTMIDEIYHHGFSRPMLACVHDTPAAEPRQLRLHARLILHDPSWYWMNKQPIGKKRPQWIMASLRLSEQQSVLEKSQFRWPIIQHTSKISARRESEIIDEYADAFGVISPRHAGIDLSGWWRVRYVHAYNAGCLVWCQSPNEATLLGPSYEFTPPEVEDLSDAQLMELIVAQRRDFESISCSRDQYLAKIESVLQEV